MSAGRSVAVGAAVLFAVAVAGAAAWFALTAASTLEPGAPASVPSRDPTGTRTPRPRARVRTRIDAEAAAESGLRHLRSRAAELERRIAEAAADAPKSVGRDGRVTSGDGVDGTWDESRSGTRAVVRGAFAGGRRDGLWVEIDELGGRSETEYVRGVKHGREAAWRADGTPRFLGTYSDGELSGTWTSWHETGYLLSTREYVSGKITGTVCEYHPNGVLQRESIYRDGKDVGPTTGWYDDGSIEYVVPYVDGLRQGDAVWYHRCGAVSARGTYVDDRLDGTYRTYDPSGAEIGCETWDHGTMVLDAAGRAAGEVATKQSVGGAGCGDAGSDDEREGEPR